MCTIPLTNKLSLFPFLRDISTTPVISSFGVVNVEGFGNIGIDNQVEQDVYVPEDKLPSVS